MSNTDNFDSPDEMDVDQVPDQDVDFDDFEDGKDKSLKASWKSSPLFKFGIVGLVIVIVVALISILGSDKIEAPRSVVSKGSSASLKQAPGTQEVSPVMKEAIEEKNEQRIDEAQKQGISAIPTPIAPPKTLLEVPKDDAQSEDPLLRWQQMQTERAKAQREQQLVQEQQTAVDPQRENKVTAVSNAMAQQISTILSKNTQKEMRHAKVYTPPVVSGGVDASGNPISGSITQVNATTTTGASAIAAQKPPKVIVPAGKIEYAQNILEANSDIPGPVIALLASGEFSGGKLIGKFQAREEYLVITFNQLVTKKGTSIPINAFAVDPGTSLTGMATDVDHRYLKRIILPAAAKFVQGLGDAYSETTSETTQNATTTTTSSKDLNTKQEFGKAVGEAAKSIGDVLDEDGKNTKPLVIVAAGTPMGILFMEPITDQTILTARGGGANQVPVQNGQTLNQNGMMMYGNQGYMQPLPAGMSPLQQFQFGLQNQQLMQQNQNNGYATVPADTTTSTSTTTGQ